LAVTPGGDPPQRADRRSWPPTRETIAFHAARIGVAAALAVLTYLLFPASPAVDFPVYEVGSVASDNVIAPFAFHVLKTPAELANERDLAVRGVEPVFDFAPAALDTARRAVTGYDGAITQAAATGGGIPQLAVPAIQRASSSWGVSLSVGQAIYLGSTPRRAAMFQSLERVFDRWLSAGVATAGALDSVHGDIVIRSGTQDRRISSDSVATFFHPTIVPDRAATQLRQDDARRAVPTAKYDVLAGEKIIGANEVVGREQYDKLRALRDATDRFRGTGKGSRRVVGAILFDFLLIALLGITLIVFRPDVYRSFRWLLTVGAIVALVLIGAAVVALPRPVPPELIPVALAAVLMSALFDQRISLIGVMVPTTLVAGQSVFRGTNALFINLVGAAVAALSVGEIRRRNQSYRWIVAIGGAYLATAAAIGLTLDLPSRDILVSGGLGVLNALGSVLLGVLLLPMAEAFTGIETDLTLLEWSDLNRPLMQRL